MMILLIIKIKKEKINLKKIRIVQAMKVTQEKIKDIKRVERKNHMKNIHLIQPKK
jgi:hypothetical protein